MIDFRLGELFCGAGGLALGAKLARNTGITLKHSWAVDYDKDACETYKKNVAGKDTLIINTDIRKLSFDDLPLVNALAFGFPCNDFSVVGTQEGIKGSFGALYTYCVQALEKFRPEFFIAENVSGLRNANDGKALKIILDDFSNCGYKIYPHLYKLDQYGIPQKRNRIFIVGFKKNCPHDFKIPSFEPYITIDNTVKTALSNIPDNAWNNELTKQSAVVVERLSHIKEGENAFNASLPEHLKLNVVGAKLSQIYKRLVADKPAYTITASGGGGTHVYHYKENRALTNRERARLQTFPDDFIFSGSKESVRKQIGMAVPPLAGKIIFEAVFKSLQGQEYPFGKSNMKYKEHLEYDFIEQTI